MFSPWGSQIPVRKHKDPITGNSYIVTKMWRLKMRMVLSLVCGPYFSRPLYPLSSRGASTSLQELPTVR